MNNKTNNDYVHLTDTRGLVATIPRNEFVRAMMESGVNLFGIPLPAIVEFRRAYLDAGGPLHVTKESIRETFERLQHAANKSVKKEQQTEMRRQIEKAAAEYDNARTFIQKRYAEGFLKESDYNACMNNISTEYVDAIEAIEPVDTSKKPPKVTIVGDLKTDDKVNASVLFSDSIHMEGIDNLFKQAAENMREKTKGLDPFSLKKEEAEKRAEKTADTAKKLARIQQALMVAQLIMENATLKSKLAMALFEQKPNKKDGDTGS